MAGSLNEDAVSRAVSAARGCLSPEDAAKLEAVARNKDALRYLTAGMSERDWNNVMNVLNNPALLRRVISSPQGQAGLKNFLKQIP